MKKIVVIWAITLVLGMFGLAYYLFFVNPSTLCWDGIDELGRGIGSCEMDLKITLFSVFISGSIWILSMLGILGIIMAIRKAMKG